MYLPRIHTYTWPSSSYINRLTIYNSNRLNVFHTTSTIYTRVGLIFDKATLFLPWSKSLQDSVAILKIELRIATWAISDAEFLRTELKLQFTSTRDYLVTAGLAAWLHTQLAWRSAPFPLQPARIIWGRGWSYYIPRVLNQLWRCPRAPVLDLRINMEHGTIESYGFRWHHDAHAITTVGGVRSLRKRRNSWKIPMSHSWERITLPFPWVTHGKELCHLHLGLLMG